LEDGESFAVRFLQMLGIDLNNVVRGLSAAFAESRPADKVQNMQLGKEEAGEADP
jgi:hypothetical protein